jgi:NAD(P)-dependent dehydrogenase (short-subunit alcohol dehydrogenase family)
VVLDVTAVESVEEAFMKTSLAFGGVDIIVNNAGIAISGSAETTSEEDWDKLENVIVKGSFLTAKSGSAILIKQGLGGDIVNIVSKNSIVAGPNNLGYGVAKAAQGHMTRLMAVDFAKEGIRVNTVNPDAVIAGSNIWEGGWAENRAKTYGISKEELPMHYAKRNLLNVVVETKDIARAVLAFVDGTFKKSTGNTINVDGGVAAAFVR